MTWRARLLLGPRAGRTAVHRGTLGDTVGFTAAFLSRTVTALSQMQSMNLDDTIVAISSPLGPALRGIVRLSGPDAIRIAGRLFTPDDGTTSAGLTKGASPSQNGVTGNGVTGNCVTGDCGTGVPPVLRHRPDPHATARPPAATKVWHGRPARDPTGETPVPQVSSRDAKIPIISSTGGSGVVPQYTHGTVRLDDVTLPAAVYLFRAPRSYTREDVVELHLLGAPGVLAMTVEACLAAGARRAEPGEFTARAYLAGAFDLSQVHAIAGLIAARSDHQLQAAQRLLHGALGKAAYAAREELADLLSLVEGALDFSDEPIEFITPTQLLDRLGMVCKALKATAAAGLLAERWGQLPRVLLVGPPNVGKSSLLNVLTGLDRAICAPVAGTTRDILSAPLTIGETECLLVDVAGIEEARTELDARTQVAVRRAIEDADLILHVIDIRNACDARSTKIEAPGILVANKCDLASHEHQAAAVEELASSWHLPVCATSAATGTGCDVLKNAIRRALEGRPVDVHDAAIALMAEHREALQQAIGALENAIDLAAGRDDSLDDAELVAEELRTASRALGMLVGEEQTEDMLGRIFSRFCVGK
ncbi:MAG: tRNA modification GTPase [Phycisphaerae bacterium]|nr:tRNA modification GTPase [Phycisphaerae bacterium]